MQLSRVELAVWMGEIECLTCVVKAISVKWEWSPSQEPAFLSGDCPLNPQKKCMTSIFLKIEVNLKNNATENN